MSTIASQITSLTIVYSTVYSGANQRKHQYSASLAFVQGIHRGPVNSPHKWQVTRKMFPFDDVIMWRVFYYRCMHGIILSFRDLMQYLILLPTSSKIQNDAKFRSSLTLIPFAYSLQNNNCNINWKYINTMFLQYCGISIKRFNITTRSPFGLWW